MDSLPQPVEAGFAQAHSLERRVTAVDTLCGTVCDGDGSFTVNVLFINCVCSNTGDAAIFQGAAAVMRRAWGHDAEFMVQDDHPQRVQQLYADLSVRPSCYWSLAYTEHDGWRDRVARRVRFWRFALARRLNRPGLRFLANRLLAPSERDYLDAYRRADVVVATGGTYLVEQYDLGQRLFDMQTAIAMKRPLVLFTQSMGPFRYAANRRQLGRVFRKARLILLRERRSLDYLRELGVPERHLRIVPDAAFALADDDLATRQVNPFPLAKPHPRIAISVRRWNHFADGSSHEGMQRYCAAFAALTVHLIARYGAEVTFVSTCQGAPGYHDDSHVAKTIVATLPDDARSRVRVDGEFHTPNELSQLLRDFDWVVATRMHLAILTLGVGTPILPIAYEFKTTELFKSLGYEVEPPSIDTLTSEGLIAAFDKSVADYCRAARRLHEAVDRNRRCAWQVVDLLREGFPEFAPFPHGDNGRLPTRCDDSVDRLSSVR
jgi:colanic acid/amylovoran biosynthesis protein